MLGKDFTIPGPQINQFNNIAPKKIPRSKFIRSHSMRTTFNPDILVPIFTDEILPGDDASLKMNSLVRMSTPIKPLMDNLYFDTFWFFVPNRLVWTNWVKHQGQQTNPGDSVAYTIPVLDKTKHPMDNTGFLEMSIYDYLELPIKKTGLSGISAMYNRAIDLIWNEWFRNEAIQNSLTIQTGDGPDDPAIYDLRKRNKVKDYFTSCLPAPQRGSAITFPLGTSAPVTRVSSAANSWTAYLAGGNTLANNQGLAIVNDATGRLENDAFTQEYSFDPRGGLIADLSSATAATINQLRQAALYQQIAELDARGGTRYVENLFSRFGVVSPDFRLQRPELIGQGSSMINVYSVPQTSVTAATPQGNLAAFSATQVQGHGFHYSATEHGMIIGLGNVRADLTYQQGIPKKFLRSTRLDFYEPLLNGLGEQAVLNNEIWADGSGNDVLVLGYQERWSEYRYKPSTITGLFRSDATGTLDIWHASQKFTSVPTLNTTFITQAMPISRIIAVNTEPAFLMDAHFQYSHVRAMPMRSNPGIDVL